MKKQLKTRVIGTILAMFLIIIPFSLAISIDELNFANPIGLGSLQEISANVNSLNSIESVKIEIDNSNKTMLLVSGAYRYSYIPLSIGNVSFRVFAQDNESNISSNGVFEVKDLTPPTIISSSPSGKKKEPSQTLIVATNEDAACRFDVSDKDYSLMDYNFDGLKSSHYFTLNGLAEGEKTYYVRCMDMNLNSNAVSTIISFEIDTTPPTIVSKEPVSSVNSETASISLITTAVPLTTCIAAPSA